ncbi:protease inhibitor/seed storage/lipid transfer protein (LTP) family protein [Arabidopsis thaliana]|nr:protease inhibitor/seed storage/lipid transfer protein (LTP) family protein [Arabidopsis thaliana]AEE84610.1 protease inhibitor/seed storage/lipid transfer protein (LTP) family protein [Arabidopsis thaliana]|eukprot:NP_193978.2 protease inhibitor/seed storage/lipid transfer protein (LTP) family protein [Arabidopsis thaliana]
MASTTIILFLSFSIIPLLTIVRADNHSVYCPPPPPCICICNPGPPPPQPDPQPPTPPTFQPAPPANDQPPPPPQSTSPPPVATTPPALPPKPLPPPLSPPQTTPPPPPAITPPPPPAITPPLSPPPPAITPPPPLATTPPALPPKPLPPPLSPPQTTPPPPPAITPPLSPPLVGICSKNDTELKICAGILAISDGLLTTGRAEPCCSIIRNVSDLDAVTCFCKSVGAPRFSLSPNFGIFFKVCGRRIPQGFSCPGPSPTISPPPLPPQTLKPPPPQTTPPPPPAITPPLSPPLVGICSKNDTELKICAGILAISDGLLTTGRAEPCCSIVRNVSDLDAVTCFCKSVGARRFSLSPNFGIFFKVCGRRIPQGFSCP